MTTPSQTVGPFFGFALPYESGPHLVPVDHPEAITLRGTVLDGAADPLPDALVEIWQAPGFGRCPTGQDGGYFFRTVPPRPYAAMLVFARGLLKPVATRVYLPGTEVDPAVAPDRRGTLIAQPEGDRAYRFDVRLQGEGETVFFAV